MKMPNIDYHLERQKLSALFVALADISDSVKHCFSDLKIRFDEKRGTLVIDIIAEAHIVVWAKLNDAQRADFTIALFDRGSIHPLASHLSRSEVISFLENNPASQKYCGDRIEVINTSDDRFIPMLKTFEE